MVSMAVSPHVSSDSAAAPNQTLRLGTSAPAWHVAFHGECLGESAGGNPMILHYRTNSKKMVYPQRQSLAPSISAPSIDAAAPTLKRHESSPAVVRPTSAAKTQGRTETEFSLDAEGEQICIIAARPFDAPMDIADLKHIGADAPNGVCRMHPSLGGGPSVQKTESTRQPASADLTLPLNGSAPNHRPSPVPHSHNEMLFVPGPKLSTALSGVVPKEVVRNPAPPDAKSVSPAGGGGEPQIYVLSLSDEKYYVGVTTDVADRWEKHVQGKGSEWTRRYPPKSLLRSFPRSSMHDEDNQTIELMAQFGIDNVRGGSYCDVQLPEFLRLSLIHILASPRARANAHFRFGRSNVGDCRLRSNSRSPSSQPLERLESSGIFVLIGLILVTFLMLRGFGFG